MLWKGIRMQHSMILKCVICSNVFNFAAIFLVKIIWKVLEVQINDEFQWNWKGGKLLLIEWHMTNKSALSVFHMFYDVTRLDMWCMTKHISLLRFLGDKFKYHMIKTPCLAMW